MGLITYQVPEGVQRMTIGVQGEANVREFLFDVTEWRQITGDLGTAEMVVQRRGDSSPYAAAITMHDENTVSWVPTAADTAKDGVGNLQLMWIASGQTVKTKIFDMKVDPALDYDLPDDSLDPWASWMPDVINAAAEIGSIETKVDTRLDSQDAAIAAIRAAVGSPLVANTAAAMTDQNKIYVYTGDESGLTAGNWYYYDGSAWASGGVYNSAAVETDTTLRVSGMPADAKAAGDEIESVKSALNTFDCSALFMEGYFPINGNIYKSFVAQSNWRTCKIRVLPGEKVIVTGSGSNVARLWGFTTDTGIITRCASQNAVLDDAEFITADGEAYFVFNATTDSDIHPPALKLSVDRSVALEELRETLYSDDHTFDCRRLFVNGYYPTNGTFIGNFTASDNYRTCILCVDEGETITLTGTGATSARLWAFADENKRITRRSDASASIEAGTLTVSDGEKYFIYNSSPGTTSKVAYLSLRVSGIESLEDLRKRVCAIEYNSTPSRTIKNNLASDGMWNLPHSRAIKDGTVSDDNYGLPGTKYEIDLGDFDKCHVYFCYKHMDYVDYSGADVVYPIASLGQNNALNLGELYRGIDAQYGALYRTSFFYPANQNAANSITLNPQFYNPLNGEDAVFIRYTGDLDGNTTVNVIFSSSSVSFVVNGNTIGTIQLNNTDSIQSLADSINAITDFSCEIRKTSGTINDLLLPTSMTINMVESVTRSGTQHYGSTVLSVPFKIDKRVHTCEFVVDKKEQKAYVAFDGVTRQIIFSEAKALTDGMLVLGGNYTTASNVIIKDLEIDINNLGDCEIVTGKITNASETDTIQLISRHNPRLMIFEGHGITTMSETEAQAAYVESGSDTSQEAMQASTDRLNTVFDELNSRGYIPVSIPEIVEWKAGKRYLPKRCYACIFDDYRIENYLDYEKRMPMIKHSVIPALALITNMHNLSDTVTVNGVTYSFEDALQIIKGAGWFCCSHTAGHRYINQYTVEENITLFEEDVISADKHFINSNVIVYPYGAVNAKSRRAFTLSDFAIGITIVAERYNCLATADYLLGRTEIGTRATLENVLAPFI